MTDIVVLNITLEWMARSDVNSALHFIITAADKGPSDGEASILAEVRGVSPLTWILDGPGLQALPDEAKLWVFGPSCEGTATPPVGVVFDQTVDFHGSMVA